MINNIWFKIIARKINEIAEFYTIFARKMPDYIIRQRDRGQAEAKNLEAEAEAKILASRPLWPRGLNITAFYTLYHRIKMSTLKVSDEDIKQVLWQPASSLLSPHQIQKLYKTARRLADKVRRLIRTKKQRPTPGYQLHRRNVCLLWMKWKYVTSSTVLLPGLPTPRAEPCRSKFLTARREGDGEKQLGRTSKRQEEWSDMREGRTNLQLLV